MQATLENEFLRLTVSSHGAEPVSVVEKATGEELLWQADPALWARHAPLLFPYCGQLRGGHFAHGGETYTGGQHGFARDMEFLREEAEGGENALRFVLQANSVTMEKYPFAFTLAVTYTLEEHTVCQTVAVRNDEAQQPLRYGLGFHPAFNCPFDAQHTPADYYFAFDTPQTPMVQEAEPQHGLMTGLTHALFHGETEIPVSEAFFKDGSTAMAALTAKTLSLCERGSERRITVDIAGFPYVLVWAPPQKEIRFVCIEPWCSLPDGVSADGEWAHKPCAAALAPGETHETALRITFAR